MSTEARADVVISEDWAPKIGGAHYWLSEVYSRWHRSALVLTATPEIRSIDLGSANDRVQSEGSASGDKLTIRRDCLPVATVGLNPLSWLPLIKMVLRARREISTTSTVHCKAYFPEGVVGYLATRPKRHRRLVVYAHGEEILVARTSRVLRLLAGMTYGGADLVVANSENTAKLVESVAPGANTVVIHPGVDNSRFAHRLALRETVRKARGWATDEFVVLTIARLEPRKNVLAVIDAVVALRNKGKTVRYVIVGDGECSNDVTERIKISKAEGFVDRFVRVSEDEKADLLVGSDCFTMASTQHGPMIEGFGIVFLEAAAAGLPCVCGNSGGQPEAVLDGRTGIVVDGRSTREIENAIARIMDDSVMRSCMMEAAKSWARENDWEDVTAKTQEVVDLIERSPASGIGR